MSSNSNVIGVSDRCSGTIAFLRWLFVFVLSFFLWSFFANGQVGLRDFVQYWAGARAFLDGQNPYDPAVMLAIQQGLVGSAIEVVRIWNPPWALSIFLPLGYFTFSTAASLMAAITISVVVLTVDRFKLASSRLFSLVNLLPLLFVLTLPALKETLSWGQSSAIVLLGLLGFMHFKREAGQGTVAANRMFMVGLLLALTCIKPHLLFLLYIALVIESFRERNWRLVCGFIFGTALLNVLPVLLNPSIFTWYMQAWSEPPLYWQTPTVGSFLQGLFPQHAFLMRILPSLLAGAGVLIYWRKISTSMDCLLWLVPLSLVCSPYGWGYDQLVLLPLGLTLLCQKQLEGRVAWVLLAGNLLGLLAQRQDLLLWYPLLFLLVRAQTSEYSKCG